MAPYRHIEEDLKSLKEVLEMKNQQIHQQELKISELEKIVGFKFLLRFSILRTVVVALSVTKYSVHTQKPLQ